ncbi:MAG TPA: dual specificity protein phosphatase family protein [Myxococcota bacterium]|nr:dual specificity protein phosphatase family protein [Myxococcota bacterium]
MTRRRALAALAALALAAAPFAVPRVARLFGVSPLPDNWTEARAGWLYRSGAIPSRDAVNVLRSQRIGTVLDLTDADHDKAAGSAAERAAAAKLGIRYVHLPVEQPRSALLAALAQAVAEIERARLRGDRVLVHCQYGHRRSAAALALYARVVEHEPPDVAYVEFTRYSDADSTWSAGVRKLLEDNLPELRAQIAAELAAPQPADPAPALDGRVARGG